LTVLDLAHQSAADELGAQGVGLRQTQTPIDFGRPDARLALDDLQDPGKQFFRRILRPIRSSIQGQAQLPVTKRMASPIMSTTAPGAVTLGV